MAHYDLPCGGDPVENVMYAIAVLIALVGGYGGLDLYIKQANTLAYSIWAATFLSTMLFAGMGYMIAMLKQMRKTERGD